MRYIDLNKATAIYLDEGNLNTYPSIKVYFGDSDMVHKKQFDTVVQMEFWVKRHLPEHFIEF